MYDILDDTKRGFTGEGGQLNIWDSTLNKYVLFLPLETLPSVVGSVNSVEHDVTTSNSIGKIKGKMSIEDKELTFLWHRDNLNRIEKFLGQQNDFLVSYKDGTGWKFTAEYTYKPDDASASEKVTGTITLIPSSVDDSATLNVRDLMARTCMISSAIDSEIHVQSAVAKEIAVTLNVDGATFTAVSNSSSITAQVSADSKKVTITSSAVGTGIVTLKPASTGMSSWETTILVVCE